MILQLIKDKTADHYRALENSPLMKPITLGSISLIEYVEILKKFYGYFSPLENKIERFEEIYTYLPDYSSRRKAHSLLTDLRNLKYKGELPVCKNLPAVRDTAEAFGCLYVMEGSTLGGETISKILRESLKLHPYNGASFFNAYGEDTAAKWKNFRNALQAYSLKYNKHDTIVESANNTFLKLREWMEK
jgi:heme oxygenase (biliverdin-IX-beta and delta-forming)